MFCRKCSSLFKILNESPFFAELSIKEREKLVQELVETYPQLYQLISSDKYNYKATLDMAMFK